MNVCRQTDGHQPHTRHSLKKALELIHQPRQTDRQTIQTRSTGSQRAARNGWLSASVGQMRSSGCHANIRVRRSIPSVSLCSGMPGDSEMLFLRCATTSRCFWTILSLSLPVTAKWPMPMKGRRPPWPYSTLALYESHRGTPTHSSSVMAPTAHVSKLQGVDWSTKPDNRCCSSSLDLPLCRLPIACRASGGMYSGVAMPTWWLSWYRYAEPKSMILTPWYTKSLWLSPSGVMSRILSGLRSPCTRPERQKSSSAWKMSLRSLLSTRMSRWRDL
mmetsp:Transcript_22148/g.63147  ORF Transcript_22148/g.63147 Transcript_22148/m.63147 type:complete len:274 (-) Transcript_22148:547-1368(-)